MIVRVAGGEIQNQIVKGSLAACLVICIWSIWLVVSRVGAQSQLSIFDLAALRYGVSAFVTLPVVFYFKPWKNLSFIRMFIISGFLGPFYIFCVFGGFSYAPVAHGGVFLNGSLPVLTLFIGVIFYSQKVSFNQGCGLMLILLASLFSLKDFNSNVTSNSWVGDILFFISALFFSGYLVLAREWDLSMTEVIFCSSTY